MTRPPLSLLDLTRGREDQGPAQALQNAAAIAGHVEGLGFQRYRVAEHHNMVGVASAATPVVVAHVGAATQADELMLVTDTHDFAARQRSLSLTAEAWG